MAKLAGGVFLRTVRRTDGFAEAAYLTHNMGCKGRISGNLSSAGFCPWLFGVLELHMLSIFRCVKMPLAIRQLSWLLFIWNDLPGWT